MTDIAYNFNKTVIDLLQMEVAVKHAGFSNLSFCTFEKNNVGLYFESNLTENEQTSLSNLVSQFQEISIEVEGTCQSVLSIPRSTNNNDWTMLCSWAFPGRNSAEYKHINVNSCIISDNNNTYELRVYDSINNIIIAESSMLSNIYTKVNTLCLDNLALPFTRTTFELHGKANNSNATLEVKNVCVVY